jgi:tRNA(Ile)-lysidine synthase
MNAPLSLGIAILEARLDRASTAPIAVAFSGGGDSLALLHLALTWAQNAKRPVLALTVDHALHPDSALWTAEAGRKAGHLGADWRALAWEGAKPSTGLPAAARQARHALLADAAREAGARVILMGHTLSDVVEGDIMRAGDAPGLGRLREWSPSPVWPQGRGVFLLRPLLGANREDLRDVLREMGETWFDDPANEDVSHPRIRARRALANGEPTTGSVIKDGCLVGAAGDLGGLANGLTVEPDGAAVIRRASLIAAPSEQAVPVLAVALLCVSGTSRPPRGEALRRLYNQICEDETGAATLCGCRIEMGRERIVVTRAPPRRGCTLAAPEPVEWIAARFAAACGLVGTEAEARAPTLLKH